jgi:hypothetical protein
VRPRAARAPLVAVAVAVAVALLAAGARALHAEVAYEVGPTLSVGATDNATVPPAAKKADEFGTLSLTGRVRYKGKKSEQALGYRLSWTRYVHQYGPDTLTHELSYQSSYNLTAKLDLQLGATAALSRSSAFVLADAGTGTSLAIGGADARYLTTSVGQGLSYAPTARRRYTESLNFSHITYLTTATPLPDTTLVGTTLRTEWEETRNTYSLEGSLSDSYASVPQGGSQAIAGHRLFAQALAGWRRDFSLNWSAEAHVGGVLVMTTDFDGIGAPAGSASVGYRRLTWFANLTVSQTASPNIYVGNATLNDQATARLALPLTRSELWFVGGYGGYTYARVADQVSQTRAYDLWSAGASLTARADRLPLWGSLDYGVTHQNGSTLPGGVIIPTRDRQVIILSIGGSFLFGKGTPPIFMGVL